MATKDWLEVAQVVSSIAAACGLGLTAWQMRRARLVADLQALQTFFENANRQEAGLAQASDDAAKSHAFIEFLNFLGLYACAYNKGLFGSGSREMVRHKIEDSYIELDQSKAWHPQIEKATDRSTTFAELRKFIKHHKKEIAARAAERTRVG